MNGSFQVSENESARHPYRESGRPPQGPFALGDRLRIVGGEHDGRTGTVVANHLQGYDDRTYRHGLGNGAIAFRIDPESGETEPTGGRNYCRGGRGGFVANINDYALERL